MRPRRLLESYLVGYGHLRILQEHATKNGISASGRSCCSEVDGQNVTGCRMQARPIDILPLGTARVWTGDYDQSIRLATSSTMAREQFPAVLEIQ
jgi:hypothetical protein